MTPQPTPEPATPEPAIPEPHQAAHLQAVRAKHHHLLDEMIDLAATLARAHHGQAMAQLAAAPAAPATALAAAPAAAPAAALAAALADEAPAAKAPRAAKPIDHTAAFDRMSRAMRHGIHLAHSLARSINDPAIRAERAARHRIAARKHIIRVVENNLEHEPPAKAEALRRELFERLDAPEFEDEVLHRPSGDVLNDMLSDFGLRSSYGKRRTPADLATLHTIAAKPPQHPLPLTAHAGDHAAWSASTKRPPLNSARSDQAALANFANTLLLHPTRFRGK